MPPDAPSPLVTQDHIAGLRSQLRGRGELRIGEIIVDLDPFDFARTGAPLVDRAVAFSGPSGTRVAGLGTAWRASSEGPSRFVDLNERLQELDGLGVRAFLGFSFLPWAGNGSIWGGYEPAEAFVPRIMIEGVDGGSRIRVAAPTADAVEPTLELLASMRKPVWRPFEDPGNHATEANPSVSDWAKAVELAVEAIDRGDLDKVVLARSVLVRSAEPPPILRMFRELVRTYPGCYNFAWKSHDAVFMGASPELLASVHGRDLRANPLAGSAPRGEGSVQDDQLAAALLSSIKDRKEHAFVVDAMAGRLAPLAESITASDEPHLKQMSSVQHLSSTIDATLHSGHGLLDVLDAVHPTPAVGGVPTAEALALINELEAIDRGWYTGGVGWVDAHGDGVVALGLRCGLIRDTTTHLFAGAGIVEGSVADAEVRETRLKLEPLLKLLTAS
ncbi:MAG: isochorismate synthase [Acidimicrobiia bacterium]